MTNNLENQKWDKIVTPAISLNLSLLSTLEQITSFMPKPLICQKII